MSGWGLGAGGVSSIMLYSVWFLCSWETHAWLHQDVSLTIVHVHNSVQSVQWVVYQFKPSTYGCYPTKMAVWGQNMHVLCVMYVCFFSLNTKSLSVTLGPLQCAVCSVCVWQGVGGGCSDLSALNLDFHVSSVLC